MPWVRDETKAWLLDLSTLHARGKDPNGAREGAPSYTSA